MSHGYTPEQINFVENLLQDKTLAPYVKLQRIVHYCVKENIASYIDNLTADLFCIHPDNRSSLLLDWFKMHSNGANIKKAGANEARLQESVAFELSHNLTEKAAQLNSNRKLVKDSGGHVAPVTGKERWISVGASHFTQFVKGAGVGVKTPIAELQDANGCLQNAILEKDDEFFANLIKRGWRWLIFPAQAQVAWPTLPSFLQFAYNAGNSLFTPKSEMECMMDIIRMAEASETTTSEEYYAIAQQVGKAMPECNAYINTIADFARLFANETSDAKELFDFANAFGESRKIGEEFFKAIVEASFYGGKPNTKIRKACVAANLTSSKVIDGVSRLLVKSDIAKLTKLSSECGVIENAITEAGDSLAHAVKLRKLPAECSRDILFRFMIRLVLHALGKGTKSFDSRDFENTEAIKTACIDEMVNGIGKENDVVIKAIKLKWAIEANATEIEEEPVEELHIDDPTRIIFDHGGFKVGSFVIEKKGDSKMAFEIEEVVSNQVIRLRQHTLTKEQLAVQVRVSSEVLVEQWKLLKNGIKQEALSPELTNTWSPSKCFMLSRAQVLAFETLREAEESFAVKYKDKLVFCVSPREIRTRVKVPKGALKFAPFTEVNRIQHWERKDGERMLLALKNGQNVKLAPPELPCTSNSSEWNPNKAALVPFWYVGPSQSEQTATMELSEFHGTRGKFYILTNPHEIDAFKQLTVYVNTQQATPLQNATIVAPSKKRRTR